MLFFYGKVLCTDLPRLQEIGRPRPSRRLPVVLTPDEVVRILGFLEGEHRLFAQLLYGTGMRISEGLQLRVKDLDFDHGTIIVREGKGSKDRALMLPESLAPSLREQLSRARAWWLKDQAEGRSGVALPDALEQKYPRAGHSGRGSGFLRSTRIRPIHGAVSCVAITCMTRPFSAPSNVP
ncbi:tyrosine-type recombinase/integrase [Enterobacter hormaechei]|uniref:tyrosine-type recombinase/integrase n=1 Tax=Enterobacter hormaechei TaxID=158836 RepID=UPI00388EF6C5